jgi:hypothetical protein
MATAARLDPFMLDSSLSVGWDAGPPPATRAAEPDSYFASVVHPVTAGLDVT